MPANAPHPLTVLLAELRQGNLTARDELLTLVYPELRRIAAREHSSRSARITRCGRRGSSTRCMCGCSARHRSTGRIARISSPRWRARCHVLVDYARARNAQKRPGGRVAVSLSDVEPAASEREEDLVALDEALSRLEAIDPRASRVVELRFFTGLNERETAEVLDISVSTMKRDWAFAKAWLYDALHGSG